MLNKIYFLIFNSKINQYTKINLMGIISFIKSGIKHIKRKSPFWIIINQIKGIFMCIFQLMTKQKYETIL